MSRTRSAMQEKKRKKKGRIEAKREPRGLELLRQDIFSNKDISWLPRCLDVPLLLVGHLQHKHGFPGYETLLEHLWLF